MQFRKSVSKIAKVRTKISLETLFILKIIQFILVLLKYGKPIF